VSKVNHQVSKLPRTSAPKVNPSPQGWFIGGACELNQCPWALKSTGTA
jgi:hypothetical protein